MKVDTVKALCEQIWEIESNLNLINKRISGVPIWPYIRMSVYYQLSIAYGIFQEPHHTGNKFGILDKIKKIFLTLYHSIVSNPFFLPGNANLCYFEHERSTVHEKGIVDIYTIQERINNVKAGYSVVSLEKPYSLSHLKSDGTNKRLMLDFILICGKILSRFHYLFFSGYEKNEIRYLHENLCNFTVHSIDYYSLICASIIKFKVQKFLYKKLLQLLNPQELIVVVAYGNNDAILAANELGIKVTEFQHGIISKYHLGYSYPNCSFVTGFPDKIRLWTENWNLDAAIPLSSNQIKYDLLSPFHDRLAKYKNIIKDDKKITVISQGALSDKIVDFLFKNYDKFDGYQINYKLHPSEFFRWQKNNTLLDLAKHENFNVVSNCDLYELLASSSAVIGVFSTAMLEARELGATVYVIDLPGSEYLASCDGFKDFNEFKR
ncbi:conserved hypothetical protein [Gammaproteobacteria bacterium]